MLTRPCRPRVRWWHVCHLSLLTDLLTVLWPDQAQEAKFLSSESPVLHVHRPEIPPVDNETGEHDGWGHGGHNPFHSWLLPRKMLEVSPTVAIKAVTLASQVPAEVSAWRCKSHCHHLHLDIEVASLEAMGEGLLWTRWCGSAYVASPWLGHSFAHCPCIGLSRSDTTSFSSADFGPRVKFLQNVMEPTQLSVTNKSLNYLCWSQ